MPWNISLKLVSDSNFNTGIDCLERICLVILKPQLDESKEQLDVMELCQWGLALPGELFSHLSQIVLDFFACVLILVLCTFQFALKGAEATSVCFVIRYSTSFL